MQIDPSTTLGPDTSQTAQASSEPEGGGALASDFNTFLRLLTAQLNNQDPLNPVDSTEWVAQLASFSAVEQQTLTNDLLSGIAADLAGTRTLTDHAYLIGRQAAIPGPVDFDGATPVTFVLAPEPGAEAAVIEIRNDFGNPVLRRTLAPGETLFDWSGLTGSGDAAPPGRYSATVTYTRPDSEPISKEVAAFQTISELRRDGSDLLALTPSGNSAVLSQIDHLK